MQKFNLLLLAFSTAFAYNISKHLGCIRDNKNRILENYKDVGTIFDRTLESCLYHCDILGYKYAGVEAGSECYCDTKLQYEPTYIDSALCSTPCAKNTSQLCGGSWAIDVWQLNIYPFPKNTSRYLGCVQDSASRALEYTDRHILGSYTPELCSYICLYNEYQMNQFYGLENGNECYCYKHLLFPGKTVGPKLVWINESNCNLKCTGSNDTCGGAWALALYQNALSIPIDKASLSVPLSPGSLVLTLSFFELLFASSSVLWCFYFILTNRQYIYIKSTGKTAFQRIQLIILQAYFFTMIQNLVSIYFGLPLDIRKIVAQDSTKWNAITILFEDVRQLSISCSIGLMGIATLIRYENLVLIGRESKFTRVAKWMCYLEILSFFPKTILDFFYVFGDLQSRAYMFPSYIIFLILTIYSLIQESVVVYKLIDNVVGSIGSLSKADQKVTKRVLYLRYFILILADFIQVLFVILLVMELVNVSCENPTDDQFVNRILNLIPGVMVSIQVFCSSDFLRVIQNEIVSSKNKVESMTDVSTNKISDQKFSNMSESGIPE